MRIMSIFGLILGVLAIVLFWFPGVNYYMLACGIVGIVLSAIGRTRSKNVGRSGILGTMGLVFSIIGTCLCVIGAFACTGCAVWSSLI